MKPLLLAALAVFLAHGCATTTTMTATGDAATVEAERAEQARYAAKTAFGRLKRLDAVAWPVLTANADVCPKTKFKAGITFDSKWRSEGMPPAFRNAHRELLQLDSNHFGVTWASPNSPADKAGLRRGDRIFEIEGNPAPEVRSRRGVNRGMKRIQKLFDEASEDGVLTLGIARDGSEEPIDVTMELVSTCAYPVVMQESDALNAYADGNTIYITTGMMRFAQDDLELQTVVAHELAHNTEGHIDKMRRNTMVGGILGAIVDAAAATQGIYTDATSAGAQAGAMAFSQDFEREADYVGIYYMERAGTDTSEAADFWRRMAGESMSGVVYATTHPTTPERFVNINAAVAEVRAKREAGEELRPNRKPD